MKTKTYDRVFAAIFTAGLSTLAGCSGDAQPPQEREAMRCGSYVGWSPHVLTIDAAELVVKSCVNTECIGTTIPVRSFSADPSLAWDALPPECGASREGMMYESGQWLLHACAWHDALEDLTPTGETEVIVTVAQHTPLGPGGYPLKDGDGAELTIETVQGQLLHSRRAEAIDYEEMSLSNHSNNYVQVSDDYICHQAVGL